MFTCVVLCLAPQSCLTPATPWTVAFQAPLSMGILQARILEWVAMPSSRRSSQPRDRTQVSCIAGRFFTSWATREAQTGVGNLSLFQRIFPTQESNQGLLYCRWILYQLNCQGSPYFLIPPSICVSEIVDSVNRFKSSKKGNPCAISNRLEMKLLLHLWILESVNIAI